MPKASPTSVVCDECGKTISRISDLSRHAKTHLVNRTELMYPCTFPGCTYRSLQRSNLSTHMNVHTGEKPNQCPEEGCEFRTSDPGSLTRHRKAKHGYKTANSRSKPSTRSARQQRRVKPYPTASPSFSPSSSMSPLDRSPCPPPLPDILGFSPPFALGQPASNDAKNEYAAYLTKVTDEFGQSGSSTSSPNHETENIVSSTSTLLIAPEVPGMVTPQLPMPQQENFYAFDATTALPTYPLNDPQLDSFLAELSDFVPAPVFVPPAPLDSCYLPDAPLYSTLLYGDNNYSDLGTLPTLPQVNAGNNQATGYENFGYSMEGPSFDDEFFSSHSHDHTNMYAPYDAYNSSTLSSARYYGY